MNETQEPKPAAESGTREADGLVFEKYRNPDPRCGYPFELCCVGYCWSFAHHVDGTKGYEDMEKICPRCDLFTPNIGICVKTHNKGDRK